MTGVAMAWLWASGAWATSAVTTTFCFQFNTAFTDAGVADLLTGTFTEARGVRVQWVDETTNTVVNDLSMDDETGCVTLDNLNGTHKLFSNHTYTVKVLREAVVEGNTILVRNGAGGTYTSIPKTGLAPTANHTYSYANGDFWTRLAASTSVSILATAQWAIHHRPAGLTGETFEFRNANCGNGALIYSCFDTTGELLWIADPTSKFTTAFILGLAVANFKNGHGDAVYSDVAALDDCVPNASVTGVLMNTKEYSSAAAAWGIGAFYAAAVLNDNATDADCEYRYTTDVNWNADFDSLDPDEDQIFSCEGSPAPNQSPPAPASDYFAWKCFANGQINNRTTMYDWLKTWWDYHTGEQIGPVHVGGYTVAQILNLWDAADPDTWTASGDLGGGTTNYPYDRLFDADGGVYGDLNEVASINGTTR